MELTRFNIGAYNMDMQRRTGITKDYKEQLLEAIWEVDIIGLERVDDCLEDNLIQLVVEQEDDQLVVYFFETTQDLTPDLDLMISTRLGTIKDHIENRFVLR